MRKYLALLAVSAMLWGTNALAREFKEIPLPDDIEIVAPPDGLSPNFAFFLGAWEGKWGEELNSILVITEIDDRGIVKGYYGWGSLGDVKPGYAEITGKIRPGGKNPNISVLRFKLKGGALVAFFESIVGDGLGAKFILSEDNVSDGEFSKTEL